jgi:threonylcarbamoyladenosine tRNA methylthiotransferase CDKAL1
LKVYFETYGCALNRADTSIMKYILQSRGHEIVKALDEADVIVINTCTVRLDSELRMIKRVKELRKFALNRGVKLVIAGCMASAQPYTLAKIAPEASLISPQNVTRIAEAVEGDSRAVLLGGERDISVLHPYVEGASAEIPIAEGCLGDCAFCIVKIARRRLRSYPTSVVVNAVKEAVTKGAVEIDLTAQDTGSYGVDFSGRPLLARLLSEILEKVRGDYYIRIGMMNPDSLVNFLDEFLDVLRHPKVFKYVHLPLQSGSDRVLRIIRRKYTYDEYRALVKELRRKILGISIATDIIVGHPGEDEEDFRRTVEAVKELAFDKVHIAQYTIRPRTVAASMKQIPEPVKKMRSTYLGRVVEEIGKSINTPYVGSVGEALISTRSFRGSFIGRLINYKPVVILQNEYVEGGKVRLGDAAVVRVDEVSFYDLRGVPLKVIQQHS